MQRRVFGRARDRRGQSTESEIPGSMSRFVGAGTLGLRSVYSVSHPALAGGDPRRGQNTAPWGVAEAVRGGR